MLYDVNHIVSIEEFDKIKCILKRADVVTYICKMCNTSVTKGSRCYKNTNNLCHSCAVKSTIKKRDKGTTTAIYAKVQAARKLHQTEINAKISAAHAKRTIAQKREAADKRIATCKNLYGTSGFRFS